ncbi:MAG TPA: FAD-dependent oxidoreductase [Steroidobacteraceae bacterium]|nr:FAD-dependent oxidoreductase [Steroidobacteraceae bacterium]
MQANSAARRRRPLYFRLTEVSRTISKFWSSLFEGLAWPYIEFAIRLWIAKLFFVFGILQLTHWPLTLELASQENPIPFLAPEAAAFLSTAIYLVCAALLVLGFMTRYAALPLLALSFVTQLRYEPFDTQLFWIALSGWFVIHGAGALSLDNLLRRGLSDSAVPLIPAIIKVSTWLRMRVGPLYVAFLRVWLGLALLMAVYADTHRLVLDNIARWFPLDVAVRIPAGAALMGGILLVIGAGTRYVATALLVSLVAASVVDPRATDSIYLLMFLAILAIYGGGGISIDRATQRLRDRFFPVGKASGLNVLQGLPRVVIVGAGFGGLRCAQALRDVPAAVTLIDRTNYHLFQPLLYQVATAALSPGDIATPARQMFRNSPSTRLLLGTVTAVDTARQMVSTQNGEIPYDYLVLATGATHSYFGQEAWAPFAPGLKRVEDALEIRRRILTAFERAEATSVEAEREGLLTFLIVGGGPTGVELAGAIAELARYGLENDFRAFDPSKARVILVQAAPRLLPSFPERLANTAQRSLEQLGVEVHLGGRVDHIDAMGVSVNGRRIEARTVLWAAGVSASPAAMWLNAAADKAGRLIVEGDLRVPGLANVFGIGDTVASNGWKGELVPGLAPAAKQGGAYVAKQIRALIEAKHTLPAFRYRHYGSLATIGRKAAVADFGFLRLSGAPAWWLWGIVHLGFMLDVRNRVSTLINWFWAYLRFGGSIRLITGS